MRIVVPDASVLLKWTLAGDDEHELEQALKLRDAAVHGEVALKVPSLWLYEVGNTLSRRFPKQCKQTLEALLAFGIEEPSWNKTWLEKCS